VRDVRQEMLYRGERFADTLAAIQEATAKMRKEAVEMREQQKALTADFNVLRNTTTKVHELSSVGRSAENEIASSISRLFAKIATARDKLEDAQDEIGRVGIQKEEEKARAIMLQESLSRTEHELTMSNRESSLSVSKLKLRVEELSSLLVAEKEARAETDQRLHQAHKSLDASTAAARDLQEQNRNITEALDDTSLRHTSDRQELDSRAIELAAQLKAALQDRDKEMQARLELADRLAMAENMVDERRHALDATREELNQNRQAVEEMRQKQSAAMNNVGSTHQKYEEQLANMRSVIQTLKESRAELNTQNQVMREELRALESVASRETRGGTD
jgi:chromosome segregation protein